MTNESVYGLYGFNPNLPPPLTPKIILAGVYALGGFNPELDSPFDTVVEVYLAMETERLAQE